MDRRELEFKLRQWKLFVPSNGDEEALRRRAIRMFSQRIREAQEG